MLLNFYRFSVVHIVPFPLFRRLNLIFPAGISNQPADGGGRGLSYDFKAGGKNFTLPSDLLSNKQHVSGHPSVQITPCQRPALGLCDGQQTGGREEPSPVFSERARHRDGRPLGAARAPGSTRRPATFFLFCWQPCHRLATNIKDTKHRQAVMKASGSYGRASLFLCLI